MLKFSTFLTESLNEIKKYVKDEGVAKYLASEFKIAHNFKVIPIVGGDTYDVEDKYMEEFLEIGRTFPVVLELADETLVMRIDPFWDEDRDPDRSSFLEGDFKIFKNGKVIQYGFAEIEKYRHAKGFIFIPDYGKLHKRWNSPKNQIPTVRMGRKDSSNFHLLLDSKVERINSIFPRFRHIIVKRAAGSDGIWGKHTRYAWGESASQFPESFIKVYGYVPKDGEEIAGFGNTYTDLDFQEIKRIIEKLNKLEIELRKEK